ncbi:MAG: CPBP family intramembrane metalloprotease [Planctomycetes bacterium]|nr:CPBP family intramembrane metalloprotease [Planctomycetota bacterium]
MGPRITARRVGAGLGLLGTLATLTVSSFAFAACHWVPRRRQEFFTAWSVWEGMILGGAYLYSGSLLVAILVHGLHDVLGYALFARQRRTGWMA